MTTYELILGDCMESLKKMPDGLVQVCVTSPPYFNLRDYGIEGQIGLEETPEDYVAGLVAVFREVRRVLRNDGTLWINIGDCYNGSGKGPTSQYGIGKQSERQGFESHLTKVEGCKPKDLIGIPWMVAFALRADGWYLRQEIIWHKPNPMPESVKDRPTRAHEQIFLLSKNREYFYDADAIKEPTVTRDTIIRDRDNSKTNNTPGRTKMGGLKGNDYEFRNKRSVWTIPTSPYRGAHFATFPPALVEPCILAGSKPGTIVLDPFNGSGTTGAVAVKHGRDYIGLELNPDYLTLAHKRISEAMAENRPTLFGEG